MRYARLNCIFRLLWSVGVGAVLLAAAGDVALGQERSTPSVPSELDIGELFRSGGVIGAIILALSVAMVALVVEHLLSIRRKSLMPTGLSDESRSLIQTGRYKQAEEMCRESQSFLGYVLAAGLVEVGQGYSAVEKAMEDASTQQAARLFRKAEYLSVIGTIAPMLGLLGTVWGMMLAFFEFTAKANPQVSELAPGIYKALVTTLLGLGVAVPALASFAIFRNRIDELVAAASLEAEAAFAEFKRTRSSGRRAAPMKSQGKPEQAGQAAQQSIPPVAIEREPPR